MACAFVGFVRAGNRPDPVLRTVSEFKVSTAVEGDTTFFYLYHVGRKQLLTKGARYGSHAALDSTFVAALPYVISQSTAGYTLYSPQAAYDKYLFRRDYVQVYTDYNSGNMYGNAPVTIYWDIIPNGDGTYRLKTPVADAAWGEHGPSVTEAGEHNYLFGWNPDAQDANNSETNQAVSMLDTAREGMETDWAFVSEAGYNQYLALLRLRSALDDAEEAGVAIAAAEKVYNEGTASAEEIDAVTEALREAIINKLFAEASEDNPADITDLKVVNADFSEGSLNGWVCENNVLVYNSDTYPNSAATADNGGETFSKVIAAWRSASSGGHPDDNIYQVVKGLPAGKYSLTASVVAQHGADLPRGVFLYMKGVVDAATECTFDPDWFAEQVANNMNNQIIQHPVVEIAHAGGDLTIGLRMESTNCNWVYADNFRLFYYGPTNDNPYLIALKAAMEKAEAYADENTYYYSVATAAELSDALNEATALMASAATDEQLQEVRMKLDALVEKIKEEVVAYQSLKAFMEKVAADGEKYAANPALQNLSTLLGDFYAELNDHYDFRDVSAEQIRILIDTETYQAKINAAIAEAMQQATPENPIEITSLYVANPDFEAKSLEGWTNEGFGYDSATIPNYKPEPDYNNGYTFSNYVNAWVPSSSSVADATLSQTLTDMPAGLYILGADVVAQHGSDLVTGVQLFLSGSHDVEGYTECNVKEYVMNQYIMRDKTARIYHLGGDLTIGLRTRSTNANWVIADNFSLSFGGKSVSAMYETMLQLQEQALELSGDATIVHKADEKMTEALNAAEAVSDTDEESIANAIILLGDAISYTKQAIALVEELDIVYHRYQELIIANDVESEEPGYNELLGEVDAALEDVEFESNEQVQDFIDRLHNGWAFYVEFPVLETSSEAEPGDITPAIYNAGFVDPILNENNANGWDVTMQGGKSAPGYNVFEFYNNDSFRISQTINGLAEGYYRIRVQAFYRPGTNKDFIPKYAADPAYGRNVVLFGQTESKDYKVAIKNILQREDEDGTLETDPIGVGELGKDEVAVSYNDVPEFYIPNSMYAFSSYAEDLGAYWNERDVFVAAGESLTVGLRKEVHIADDWCIFDNFQLYYLGKSEPTGIGCIEETKFPAGNELNVWYNLAGQRVSKAVKGLYIVNGKKVLVR